MREGDTVERGQPLIQLNATELRTRLSKLREELAASAPQRQPPGARQVPASATLEKGNGIARLRSEIAALESALKQTTITAPTSGVITTLEAHSAGVVLQPGQEVAVIAPAEARLVVEARVPNKDIAFVEKGLPAKLKFDAFPFQDYGSVAGTIIDVSPDAQTDKEQGSFYKVMIAPELTTILVKGKAVPLRLGLALTAEIITERKTVLAQFLEPFRNQ